MVDNSKEPKLTYALDTSGKMVHVLDVARGKYCNCRCPKCKEPLDAKQGNGGRQPHFAHQKNSDCQGAYMSALHKLAEQIIEEEKAVMVPSYKIIGEQKLLFKEVEVEQRVDRNDMQPDLVGITEDSKRWIIEIRNTHEVDITKRQKIIDNNITCLEINVRDQTLENLKSFLLESTENREWINNPIYEKRIEEIKREKVLKIVKFIETNHELPISNGDNIPLQDIHVFVSKDGLYVKIKAVSSNGIPYLFHIGSYNELKQIKATKKCNELLIDIEKNPLKDGTVFELYMERLYLYIPTTKEASPLPPCKENATLGNYISYLQQTKHYRTNEGEDAEVIECRYIEKINLILLLYRLQGDKRKLLYPYRIDCIRLVDEKYISNKVADFTNEEEAKKGYFERINRIKEIK